MTYPPKADMKLRAALPRIGTVPSQPMRPSTRCVRKKGERRA
jgi:hypothetical protein